MALLRGINVGGHNIIKMVDLKSCIEGCGCTKVKTFIQSGNVIFESSEKNLEKLSQKIETALSHDFNYTASIVLKTADDMNAIIAGVPQEWHDQSNVRCNVAFLKEPITPDTALADIEIKEGVDTIASGPGVVYMSTQIDKLSSSVFPKLVSKKIYKKMTIRNLNTTQKLYHLMHEDM